MKENVKENVKEQLQEHQQLAGNFQATHLNSNQVSTQVHEEQAEALLSELIQESSHHLSHADTSDDEADFQMADMCIEENWDYCSVHVAVQRSGEVIVHSKDLEETDTNADELVLKKHITLALPSKIEASKIEIDDIEAQKQSEQAGLSQDTAQDQSVGQVAEASSLQAASTEAASAKASGVKADKLNAGQIQEPVTSFTDTVIDIDVLFPKMLLTFDTMLNTLFDDLLCGLKHYDLYSMGSAQMLKLEARSGDSHREQLRYRLPIENLDRVFETMGIVR